VWSVAMPTISTESMVVGAEPVEQRPAILIRDALEAGVRGGVLALVENQLEIGSIEIGVQFGAGGAGDAVGRPGVDVVRCFGEVAAGVYVVVPGRHRVVVVPDVQSVADRPGHGGAADNRQRATLAEVVLDVDYEQRTCHSSIVPLPEVRGAGRLSPLVALLCRAGWVVTVGVNAGQQR
jgi:hypothetical protein